MSHDGQPPQAPPSKPKPRHKVDGWVKFVVVLAVFQVACFVVPQVRPGTAGMILWYFLIDSVVWLGLAGIVLIYGLIRSAFRRPFWTRWRAAGFLALPALLVLPLSFSVYPAFAYPSSHDRSPSAVRFRLPLDGPVLVGWGGATPDVNYHVIAPDQRWAYDLLVADEGQSHRGDGKKLEDYYCYGLAVLAPAEGTVQAVFDGDPDMPGARLGGGAGA